MHPLKKYHDGNIGESTSSIFRENDVKMFIYVNQSFSKKIDYNVHGAGGGNFEINLNEFSSENHINIHINDWSHFTRFQLSDCQRSNKRHQSLKYIVNTYTKFYYPDPSKGYSQKYIEGVANQLRYYRCAIPLHRFELIMQKNLVEVFLKNAYFAEAASAGLVNFIIKESFTPTFYHMPKGTYPNVNDNYYFQHVELNVAVLRHWSRNVRMFMLDPDEYLMFNPSFTLSHLNDYANKYSTIFIKRAMTYCLTCLQNKKKEAEIETFSFNKNDYRIWQYTTLDKLFVNPNTCGNLVVHWMEGGKDPTHFMNSSVMFISHFENLQQYRWDPPLSELTNKESVTLNKAYPVLQHCDPVLYKSFTHIPTQYFNNTSS